MTSETERDHGGNLDSAVARWGGKKADWLDLSTGINRDAYPLPQLPAPLWTALPDRRAAEALCDAARAFWQVPEGTGVLAAPGASALIARLPGLMSEQVSGRHVAIAEPTYNEHSAAFRAAGWRQTDKAPDVAVVVHPNNPDGRVWTKESLPGSPLRIIDESFCDVMPDASLTRLCGDGRTLVLKSFGKFWGHAGLRLGFLIGPPEMLARMAEALGPWPVSGPALELGRLALTDAQWADATRRTLAQNADALDRIIDPALGKTLGGTTLFRLYDVGDARAVQERLAEARIWSRVFPYAASWLRLGVPRAAELARIADALG